MSKGGAIRWTDEQLAEFQSRSGRPAAKPEVNQQVKAVLPNSGQHQKTSIPAQTGTEKLQALGRLRDGTMNKTEQAYGLYLTAMMHAGKILWFRFEGIKLKLADRTHLTVDFAVLMADGRLCMHDVKGAKAIVQDDAKAKMKVAAAMYPFEFYLVYPKKAKDGGGWELEQI